MPLFFFLIFVSKYSIMASVYRVYSALKDLVNKDQRGFVTPSVFNSLASAAQMNVYNNLFESAALNKRLRMSQLDAGAEKSRVKMDSEDLSVFSKSATVSLTSGVGTKPADLGRIISMVNNANSAQVGLVYDDAKIDYINRSSLSAPTADAPVALISNDIQVFPTSVAAVKLRYYKVPQGLVPSTGAKSVSQPRFGYTVTAGKEIYSAANSIDFELPEIYFSELVIEVAKMIGVNLRDQDVYAYAASQDKTAQ